MPIRSLSSATNTISAKTARPSRVAACNLRAKPCATIPAPTAKAPPHATAGQAVAEATRHAGAKSRSRPSSRHAKRIATAASAVTASAPHALMVGPSPPEATVPQASQANTTPMKKQRGRHAQRRSAHAPTASPTMKGSNQNMPASAEPCPSHSVSKKTSAHDAAAHPRVANVRPHDA